MQRLTIFQVGDVHFPEHTAPDADVKDSAFPPALVAVSTQQTELQASSRALIRKLERTPGALVVISGDLTSRGNLDEYRGCVTWLNRALLLDDGTKWSPDRIHVVPGNHDVDRQLAQTFDRDDLLSKFEPLQEAWGTVGLDVLATHSVRTTTISDATARLEIFGLNSCLGCGERRDLPGPLGDHVCEHLSTEGVGSTDVNAAVHEALSTYMDIMDAPAFSESDIDEVYSAISDDADPFLPVVVAHHNILQQALPRIDSYTDLINAGMVRSRLCSLGRPVLYLHGHIHSDPVECVSQSFPDQGEMICISAPEFKHGFNQIDVYFTDAGEPLGCVVRRLRVREHGGASDDAPVKVRFTRYESVISPLARRIAAVMIDKPGTGSIENIREELKDENLTEAEIVSAVEEVDWMGLVEVLNANKEPKHWRLRVVATNE